jgi:hypothetical protein
MSYSKQKTFNSLTGVDQSTLNDLSHENEVVYRWSEGIEPNLEINLR